MSTSSDFDSKDLSEFAAEVLAQRLTQMFSYAEGARVGDQTRPIHQMRVWSRRARAAHDLFASCFPGKEYRALGREIKAVTDSLGEARDLDVMIETLETKCKTLPEEQRPGVEAFIDRLKAQRKNRQVGVIKAIRRLEKTRVRERFATLLSEHGAILVGQQADTGVKE